MLICTSPANLQGQLTHNSYLIIFYPKGCLLLCNRIPKGNMKPELNQTQAVYPPEDPKPKVCVTTTKISHLREVILASNFKAKKANID